MKRLVSIVLIIGLSITVFSGCQSKDNSLYEASFLVSDIRLQYLDIVNSLSDVNSISNITEYLLAWARKNKISVSYDDFGSVIMSKKPTEGSDNAKSVILQCAISTDSLESRAESMSIVMEIMKNLSNLPAHGFVRAVFTENESNEMVGAENLNKNYLDSDYLINFASNSKAAYIVNNSPYISEYTLSDELNWQAPTYTKAYQLSLTGLNGGDAGITKGSRANPIVIIGDLLASTKSSGILYEIAGFNGGLDQDTYPTAASATLVINETDVQRFIKRFDNSLAKFEEKFGKTEENYQYTMTEVDMPNIVISHEISSNLVSLLYTIPNGIYLKSDDGDIIASSNIGSIGTHTGNLVVEICGRSSDYATMDELSYIFNTASGLCDVSYSLDKSWNSWSTNQDSPLSLSISDILLTNYDYEKEPTINLMKNECAIFSDRNPDLDLITYGINFKKDLSFQTNAIFDFLSSLCIDEIK